MNFTLITKIPVLYGYEIQRVSTHRYKTFCGHLRTIKWQLNPSVHLRVSYFKEKDIYGVKQTFYNDGIYSNKHDLYEAFKAFVNL